MLLLHEVKENFLVVGLLVLRILKGFLFGLVEALLFLGFLGEFPLLHVVDFGDHSEMRIVSNDLVLFWHLVLAFLALRSLSFGCEFLNLGVGILLRDVILLSLEVAQGGQILQFQVLILSLVFLLLHQRVLLLFLLNLFFLRGLLVLLPVLLVLFYQSNQHLQIVQTGKLFCVIQPFLHRQSRRATPTILSVVVKLQAVVRICSLTVEDLFFGFFLGYFLGFLLVVKDKFHGVLEVFEAFGIHALNLLVSDFLVSHERV